MKPLDFGRYSSTEWREFKRIHKAMFRSELEEKSRQEVAKRQFSVARTRCSVLSLGGRNLKPGGSLRSDAFMAPIVTAAESLLEPRQNEILTLSPGLVALTI